MSILNPISIPTGAPLPVEAKVLKTGEISVDVLKASEIPFIAGKQEDGGEPKPQNAALMAAPGKGDTWTKKADMPTRRVGHAASVVDGKIYVIGGSTEWIRPSMVAIPTLSTVEEYDTGFVPSAESSSVEPKGKLSTAWGKIKSD